MCYIHFTDDLQAKALNTKGMAGMLGDGLYPPALGTACFSFKKLFVLASVPCHDSLPAGRDILNSILNSTTDSHQDMTGPTEFLRVHVS